MLKFVKTLIKIALFSILVLVIGNLVRWKGKTISDQVQTQISHAERTGTEVGEKLPKEIKKWSSGVVRSTRSVVQQAKQSPHLQKIRTQMEDVSVVERKKLRAFIQDLNQEDQGDAVQHRPGQLRSSDR